MCLVIRRKDLRTPIMSPKTLLANEVTHAAMEPHCTLASFEIDPHTGKQGRLTVWSSTQVPYYLQHKLSLVLELPMSQIRVIKPLWAEVLAAKSEIIPLEIIAAVAARAARAPVKITYTREEVFWAHRGRPRTIIDLKTGVKNDGRITAVACKVIQDGGSLLLVRRGDDSVFRGAPRCAVRHPQYSLRRLSRADQQAGVWRDAWPWHCQCALRFRVANGRDCGEDRGGSGGNATDEPAEPPTVTVNGLRVLSYGLPECVEQVIARSDWDNRKGKLPKGRGLGMACSHYASGAANSIIRSDMPHSTVNIKIDRDGGVVVYTGGIGDWTGFRYDDARKLWRKFWDAACRASR